MEVRLLDLISQYDGIRSEIEDAVKNVLESQYFILGPKVEEFEKTVAGYCGVSYGVGVASGSDAILLSLMALGTGPGDEVITTPYTFFSTVSSISRLGATPVMVDIDPETYNIDPGQVAGAVTGKTKAILPVHLFGQTADMDRINEMASERGIKVIEDACQSIGATYKGRKAGSLGNAGCFSFFPSKNLGGCGDGGMIVTDDEEFASNCRMLRNHGGRERYYHDVIGINSRLDAIQAAVLAVKMKYLDGWSSGRRKNAEYYGRELSGINGISTPVIAEGNVSIFNQYVVRARDRDGLKRWLGENGIGCEIYYPVPLHLQKCFSYLGGREGDLPIAEKAAKETLALPIYTELTETEKAHVKDMIKEFMEGLD
ncbi:MAG: DegT/DnrJ/EryC1/StrS family aminotransferase [Candidatus Krumholzibacteriota bacterium]|nr:DegT/DnrJ/EryC1/StrS family aminotransferase [Candidatus Krumholzibacteriota bacterium]